LRQSLQDWFEPRDLTLDFRGLGPTVFVVGAEGHRVGTAVILGCLAPFDGRH
jgi:hypothetical protein